MLILLGVAVIVVGFAIRLNPLLVVVAAVFVTGWIAHMPPLVLLAALCWLVGRTVRRRREDALLNRA